MADEQGQEKLERTPPGHFVSDDLREQTARFLDELKKRLLRDEPDPAPKLGQPPE
jgi:hypothetical protein